MSDLNDKIFALMKERRLTYREACQELGRRGAAARASKARNRRYRTSMLARMALT